MDAAESYVNAAGEPDEGAIFDALINLEKNLVFDYELLARRVEKKGDKAGDLLKVRLLDAGYRLKFVQERLGEDSPY